MRLLFQNKIVFYSLVGILILGTILSIFTPDVALFKRSEDFTVYIMLGFLAAGLLFLILNQSKLVLISFCCTAILCLHLKRASNPLLRFPEVTAGPKLSIAHINVSASQEGYQSIINQVNQIDADVISFQEVTPDWAQVLEANLVEDYPNMARNVRIDPFGMLIFSKFPISEIDTFYYNRIPNLDLIVSCSNDQKVKLIASYILPPLNIREHLSIIADQVDKREHPVITLGDYNMVYWSDEIVSFRNVANLKNSRRSTLKVHYDHIFYSDEFECVDFTEIVDVSSNHLGIYGSYQFDQSKTALLREPPESSPIQ